MKMQAKRIYQIFIVAFNILLYFLLCSNLSLIVIILKVLNWKFLHLFTILCIVSPYIYYITNNFHVSVICTI